MCVFFNIISIETKRFHRFRNEVIHLGYVLAELLRGEPQFADFHPVAHLAFEEAEMGRPKGCAKVAVNK